MQRVDGFQTREGHCILDLAVKNGYPLCGLVE